MNGIALKLRPAVNKLPAGASKFFGDPDVAADFCWPLYTHTDGERYPMDFICQINGADLVPFDKAGLFPKTGLLSFFYPLEDTPFHVSERSPVCYYHGDTEALEAAVLQYEDGTFAATAEQGITFSPFEDNGRPTHHLLGEPSMPPVDGEAAGLEGCILLFELAGFQTADRTVRFWDDGTLQFYIPPADLKAGNLSAVQVRLNTT